LIDHVAGCARAELPEDLKKTQHAGRRAGLRHGYEGQRYSPLTQINKQNVGKLVPVWSYSLNDLHGREGFPIRSRTG